MTDLVTALYASDEASALTNRAAREIDCLRAEKAEMVEILREFVTFFDKAMEGFTDGYAERRAASNTPLFGMNAADLHVHPFLKARAALAKAEGTS